MERQLTTVRTNRARLLCWLVIMCCTLSIRALAGVQGQPAAFTVESDKFGAFVVSDSGRLYRVVVDLQSGGVVWEDLGGYQLRPSVSAISAQLAFVLGGDGNLYAKYWDGNAWQWSYQGNPGVGLSGMMSAISYTSNGAQNVSVFAIGDDNSLYVNWWNGQVYPQGGTTWYSLGGTALTHYVSAVAYHGWPDNTLYIKAYVVGGDGNLYVKYWDGSAWQWELAGRPDANVAVALPSATIDSIGINGSMDYVVVVGSNGHLYGWEDGTGWEDKGGSQLSNPPATAYQGDMSDVNGAFIVGGNGTLYLKSPLDAASWYSPGGCLLRPFVSATWVSHHNKQIIGEPWVFVIGGNGSFYAVDGYIITSFCDRWYGFDLSAYANAP